MKAKILKKMVKLKFLKEFKVLLLEIQNDVRIAYQDNI